MTTLELEQNEIRSLRTVLEQHLNPCDDCRSDVDCMVYTKGLCITKNVATILEKISEIAE